MSGIEVIVKEKAEEKKKEKPKLSALAWFAIIFAIFALIGGSVHLSKSNPASATQASKTSPVKQAATTCPAAIVSGDSGPAVANLQRALIKAGHGISVDENFGTRTAQAVRTARMQHGLSEQPIVDDSLWRALGACH